jgi:alkylated DNA repair dioxygenase AlkB
MGLFSASGALTPISLEDGDLAFLEQLALPLSNAELMQRLIAETDWRAESITLWGRQHLQPRLTAWHGEKRYRYSGLLLEPLPFTELLQEIRQSVELATGRSFNSVLLNYYRNERDSMGMHSDDEAELGQEPAIASLSFGAARTFILQHKYTKQSLKLDLGDGNLLLMAGQTQVHWRHGINKSSRSVGPRLNLTFRYIY